MKVELFTKQRVVHAVMLGAIGLAGGALAEGASLGLTSFDPTTIGADITALITTYVVPAIGAVLGALFGIKALRFIWRWVSGLMNGKG